MDLRLTYIDANPDVLDLLLPQKFAMEGLGKLAEAVLGAATSVGGFAVTPTAPASLSVNVGPGQVYEQEQLVGAPISSLGADTHAAIKQGLLRDALALTLVPPTTPGSAQAVLIQVQYADDDVSTQQVYNYYDATNPDVPLAGPGGSKQAQTATRQGVAQVATKYGIAATAGSQVAPTPDAGWAPLSVVTLAYGQTAITAGNIAAHPAAPALDLKLPAVRAAIQAAAGNYAEDTGSANAMTVSLPAYTPSPLPKGVPLRVRKGPSANTGALQLTINGTTYPVVSEAGNALVGGEWGGGVLRTLICDGASLRLGSGVSAPFTNGNATFSTAGAGTFTAQVTGLHRVTGWGGGAGGGFSGASTSAGGGGGAGGCGYGYFFLTAGTVYNFTIGAGGIGGQAAATAPTAGATTSFNGVGVASGGVPGVNAGAAGQSGNPGSGGNGLLSTPGARNFGTVTGNAGLNNIPLGGEGGTTLNGGGAGGRASQGQGNVGTGPGGGGGGASGAGNVGGNGAAGGLFIEW